MNYFSYEYTGGQFVLFGVSHVGTLLVLTALTWWMVRHGRAASGDRRAVWRRGLAMLLLANELSWHVWNLAFGRWEAGHMLPLHLCSVMIWVTVAVLWTGKRSLYAPVYFLGIAGAVQALITPDAGIYGFPHFRFFQTMIAHGALVAAGIWVAAVEGYRPTMRHVVRVLVALNAYAFIVWLINGAIGSNYLYMNGKPDVPSVMDYLPAWPWYIPILEILAFVLMGGLYLLLREPERGEPATEPA